MNSKNLKLKKPFANGVLSLTRASLLVLLGCMTSGITTLANAESKLKLEETEIMGARELPKVLYIVPWKKTLPDSNPLPMHSLIDEALSPIDVDVFKREVRYHEMIESSTGTGRK
jgi:hypothetical protein